MGGLAGRAGMFGESWGHLAGAAAAQKRGGIAAPGECERECERGRMEVCVCVNNVSVNLGGWRRVREY